MTAEWDGHTATSRVVDDVVFVWHAPSGATPDHEIPALEREGFTPSTYDSFEVPTSPALIMRDLADYAHFEHIHRYGRVQVEEPFSWDGPRCTLTFSFDWPLVLNWSLLTTRAHSRSVCVGLGYQLTTVVSVGGAFLTRHRVMPTPVGDGITRITLGMEVQVRGAPGLVPLIGPISHAFARRAFNRDTAADAAGWRSLSEAEADDARDVVAEYWSWARQFLPAPPAAQGAAPHEGVS